MISFSDQECEIFTGKINRPLCDMLCAAPEFLHNGFNFFLKYFYAPMICKNVVLNRLLCYRTRTTDIQRELFFKNSKLLGLGRQIGLKFYEAFGAFLAKL